MADEVAFGLKNIQVGLGSRVMLQQVNLSAPIGSATDLIGRNGVSKSTLLRLPAGRETRYTGGALIFDRKLPEITSGTAYLAAEHWPLGGDQRLRDLARHVARVHPNFDIERVIELLA